MKLKAPFIIERIPQKHHGRKFKLGERTYMSRTHKDGRGFFSTQLHSLCDTSDSRLLHTTHHCMQVGDLFLTRPDQRHLRLPFGFNAIRERLSSDPLPVVFKSSKMNMSVYLG